MYWLTEKRRVLCDKPEDVRLTAVLDATPSRAATLAYTLTVIASRNGRSTRLWTG